MSRGGSAGRKRSFLRCRILLPHASTATAALPTARRRALSTMRRRAGAPKGGPGTRRSCAAPPRRSRPACAFLHSRWQGGPARLGSGLVEQTVSLRRAPRWSRRFRATAPAHRPPRREQRDGAPRERAGQVTRSPPRPRDARVGSMSTRRAGPGAQGGRPEKGPAIDRRCAAGRPVGRRPAQRNELRSAVRSGPSTAAHRAAEVILPTRVSSPTALAMGRYSR